MIRNILPYVTMVVADIPCFHALFPPQKRNNIYILHIFQINATVYFLVSLKIRIRL